jgi:membrane associated rhomboid family serine protease
MGRAINNFGSGHHPAGKIVRRILWITIGVFIVEVLLDPRCLDPWVVGPLGRWFGLAWRDVSRGMVWQLVTYVFLHGSIMHVLMNMLGLYFLGRELEDYLGWKRFLYLYVGCGVLGGLGWLLLSGGSGGRCVGASGAVFGIIGAFAALFPHRQLTLLVFFVLPVTTSARTLAIVFGVGSLLMLRVGGGGIAHAAHLAGGVAGYLYGRHIAADLQYRHVHGRPWSASGIRAWWRRRQYKVIAESDEPVDWDEVDAVLDKIRLQGVQSLSRDEKDLLDRASREKR